MAKVNSKTHTHPDRDILFMHLKKSGLKLTKPRKAILDVLILYHGPFTAGEIYKRISKKSCDLVTIYRNISSLGEIGLLRRCDFGDSIARYEIADLGVHHHHHIICTSCNKVEPLDDCDLENINHIAKKRGYSHVTHSLEFFGICSDCE